MPAASGNGDRVGSWGRVRNRPGGAEAAAPKVACREWAQRMMTMLNPNRDVVPRLSSSQRRLATSISPDNPFTRIQ